MHLSTANLEYRRHFWITEGPLLKSLRPVSPSFRRFENIRSILEVVVPKKNWERIVRVEYTTKNQNEEEEFHRTRFLMLPFY